MSEFIEVISKKSLEQLDQLIQKLNIATAEIKKFNEESKKQNTPSGAGEGIKKTTRATQKLTIAQQESKRLARTLAREKEKLNKVNGIQSKGIQRLRFEYQQENNINKQRAIISSRLSTEYQKQQAQIKLLSRRYQDLAVKQEMGIRLTKSEERELKDVTRQINRKQTALKRVDANMQVYNRNVGNYKSAWKGLGNILKTSIMAFGAFAAVDIVKEIFNQTKEIDGLNKALKKVTSSQEDFNQSINFITELADEAGADINALQRAYTKFRASANTTNLTIAETQRIFRSVAKAGGLLGLSTDDITGAFRALEQMLSKGKVQAEEIRGQLGERLPGAFQILAKSMGLTTAELSKQLELGNVYAEEVLPKFARELEKTYDLANNKVETLTASQIRLGNEWNLFIRDIESGSGILTKAFQGILDVLTNVVSGFRLLSTDIGEFAKTVKIGLNPLKNTTNIAFAYTLSTERSRNKILQAKEAQELLNQVLTIAGDKQENVKKMLDQTNNSLESNSRNVSLVQDQLKSYQEGTLELTKLQMANIVTTLKENDALLAKKKAYEDYLQTLNKANETEKNAIKTGRKLAKAIKEGVENENLDVILSDIALGDIDISGLEEYQNMLKRTTELMKQLADEKRKAFEKDLIIGELSGLLGMLNMNVNVLSSSYETLTNKESTAFEKKIALANGVGEVVNGIGQTIFQNEQIRLQNQLALNSEYYNNLIEQASGNAEQQESLRRKQAQEERQIRQKQAENEKRASLFQIAIDTASAIVKALPNIPLSITIGAIGAAKAALVASRPVPQFKKGRKGGEETWAILGDGYKNEPVIDKKGNLKAISPNKPTLMHLDKGDSVLPNMDLLNDQIMLANVQASANRMTKENQNKGLERMLAMQSGNIEKGVMKALKKAKFVNVNNTSVDLGHQFKINRYKGK